MFTKCPLQCWLIRRKLSFNKDYDIVSFLKSIIYKQKYIISLGTARHSSPEQKLGSGDLSLDHVKILITYQRC